MRLVRIDVNFHVPLSLQDVKTLSYKIKNLRVVDTVKDRSSSYVVVSGISEGVLYTFRPSIVEVYSSVEVKLSSVTGRIKSVLKAVGRAWTSSKGRISLVCFSAWASLGREEGIALLFLDRLYLRLKTNPPKTKVNTIVFNPILHPDLVLSLSPYQDEFHVTFLFKKTGECLISCDASGVKNLLDETIFKARAERVMRLLDHVVDWVPQG